ncbi:MAG: hypothetical protein M9949_06125 [Candidatus Kapabacteria bacterium]|nr:hypothetical protein [Candidatus Kapabacteria bacterium]
MPNNKNLIPQDYESPRWSAELCDCSMPMTFDTYSSCSFNCLYCFSFNQKSHSSKMYLQRQVKSASPRKVATLLEHSLNGTPEKLAKYNLQFYNYVRNKTVMQWGGLADAFDGFEKRYGTSLEFMKIFDQYDYPLSFSTKGTWFVNDNRYFDIIKRHAHNWHFKISIITSDSMKAKAIERGVASPKERFEVIKKLSDAGIKVTLRLRPYIVGISDDYKETITRASQAGADSITTEFFCLETRADERLKSKYKEMSKWAGVDLWDFYKENSKGSGYRRLNYQFKRPIIEDMRNIAHSLGMRFYVSDAHHKEKCDFTSCCGVPPEWNVSQGQFTEALIVARNRENGLVYWKDIEKDLRNIAYDVKFYNAQGFNTNSNKVRAQRYTQTLYEYVKEIWNTPKNHKSPYSYFEGVLYPVGKDDDNNVIYKINRQKCGLYYDSNSQYKT